eukprot:5987204-Prymnesium_polylepis.2
MLGLALARIRSARSSDRRNSPRLPFSLVAVMHDSAHHQYNGGAALGIILASGSNPLTQLSVLSPAMRILRTRTIPVRSQNVTWTIETLLSGAVATVVRVGRLKREVRAVRERHDLRTFATDIRVD